MTASENAGGAGTLALLSGRGGSSHAGWERRANRLRSPALLPQGVSRGLHGVLLVANVRTSHAAILVSSNMSLLLRVLIHDQICTLPFAAVRLSDQGGQGPTLR